MAGPGPRTELHEQLARWAAQRLISSEQAARIEAAEAAREKGAQPHMPGPAITGGQAHPGLLAGMSGVATEAAGRTRGPLVVEALGYAGGVMALVAATLAVGTLWPGIPAGAELAFTGAATLALGAGGALVHPARAPAFGRLRSALWLMATVGLFGFTGILTARVLGFDPLPMAVASLAVTVVAAAGFWWLTRSAVLELGLFAAAVSLTGTAIAWAVTTSAPWPSGLGMWLISALWAVAVARGYLAPAGVGYLAAGVGLLAGAQFTMVEAGGHVLAIATVAGLLTAGVLLRQVLVVALGAAGVLIVIPQTASRYLPSTASAPLSVFMIALVLLACALWLARRWAHRSL